MHSVIEMAITRMLSNRRTFLHPYAYNMTLISQFHKKAQPTS